MKAHVGNLPLGEVREGLLLSDLTGRKGSEAVAGDGPLSARCSRWASSPKSPGSGHPSGRRSRPFAKPGSKFCAKKSALGSGTTQHDNRQDVNGTAQARHAAASVAALTGQELAQAGQPQIGPFNGRIDHLE